MGLDHERLAFLSTRAPSLEGRTNRSWNGNCESCRSVSRHRRGASWTALQPPTYAISKPRIVPVDVAKRSTGKFMRCSIDTNRFGKG